MREKSINRTMILCAVVFLSICLCIPVWQRAVSAGLSVKINTLETDIVALNEQTVRIKAQIDAMTNPETLRQVALVRDNKSDIASNI